MSFHDDKSSDGKAAVMTIIIFAAITAPGLILVTLARTVFDVDFKEVTINTVSFAYSSLANHPELLLIGAVPLFLIGLSKFAATRAIRTNK
jgi:hypothetical protein